jgi:hypothetical protein
MDEADRSEIRAVFRVKQRQGLEKDNEGIDREMNRLERVMRQESSCAFVRATGFTDRDEVRFDFFRG